MASSPLSTQTMRDEYSAARCDTSEMVKVVFYGWSSGLWVERHTKAAWGAFSDLMKRHDYKFRESSGGTYNCRKIAGSSKYSLHSYGLALDLNPSENPYGTNTTDQPKAFRDDIEAITAGGRQVFEWGGDWSGSGSDPMHWQVGATKAELAKGVKVPNAPDPKPPSPSPSPSGKWPNRVTDRLVTIDDDRAPSDYERATALVQALCAAVGHVAANTFDGMGRPDGIWGSGTTSAVKLFQKDNRLKVDGIVGPNTWSALCDDMPTRDRSDGDRALDTTRRIQGMLAAWNRSMKDSLETRSTGKLYDGLFGPGTEQSVKNFQSARNITVDGIVGPDTYTQLMKPAF